MTIWNDQKMQPEINRRMIKNLEILKGFNDESKTHVEQIREKYRKYSDTKSQNE